jgi:hypothetical protein
MAIHRGSRYFGLDVVKDTINGREVSVVDIPRFPNLENLTSYIIETGQKEEWDAAVNNLDVDETAYWVLASLNRVFIEDPLDIPANAIIVFPDKILFQKWADGDFFR